MSLATNLSTCHRCPFATKTCAGPCPCTIDGRDIIEHAEKGDCPKGNFQPLARGLGDTLAHFIDKTGAGKIAHLWEHLSGRDCGCKRRQEKLNELVPYALPADKLP